MLLLAVLAIEAFHAAGGIDEPLGTGVVRMAIRADFDLDRGVRRMRFESIAASAGYHAAAVLRMDSSFHVTVSACRLRLFNLPSPRIEHNSPPECNDERVNCK
jgi:hypothetical protein